MFCVVVRIDDIIQRIVPHCRVCHDKMCVQLSSQRAYESFTDCSFWIVVGRIQLDLVTAKQILDRIVIKFATLVAVYPLRFVSSV